MNKWIWRAALVALCSLMISAQGQILFQNQFAAGPGDVINPPPFVNVGTGGFFSNPIWQVQTANIDWIGTDQGWQATPAGSMNSVDLDGFGCGVGVSPCNTNPVGLIITRSSIGGLTVGQQYSITFYLSGNPGYMGGVSGAQAAIIAADQNVVVGLCADAACSSPISGEFASFHFSGQSGQTQNGSVMNWMPIDFTFTATATSGYLFFQSCPTCNGGTATTNDLLAWGAVVADPVIQATGEVPEPATYTLLGVGLLALAGLRRRFCK